MSDEILIKAASKIAITTPEGFSRTSTFNKGMTLRSLASHIVGWLRVAMSKNLYARCTRHNDSNQKG
jgi:hypothetical protein